MRCGPTRFYTVEPQSWNYNNYQDPNWADSTDQCGRQLRLQPQPLNCSTNHAQIWEVNKSLFEVRMTDQRGRPQLQQLPLISTPALRMLEA